MSSPRFDIEKAIAAWRRPFEHNRAFSVDDIEELEGSLRDRVAARVEGGLSEEAAFREALRRMGAFATAEAEYHKVYWGKLKRRSQLFPELVWRLSMLKNYVKIAWRNLLRQKGYAIINVAGLTMGLACCMLLFQFVAFQKSHDGFHEKADRIYRLAISEVPNGGTARTSAMFGHGAGPAFAQEAPEIVRFARIDPDFYQEGPTISYRGGTEVRTFKESRVFFADSTLLSVFTFPLLKGNPETALREPRTLLLTETTARKYFGDEDPVGKTLEYFGGGVRGPYTVAGILKDLPPNSHLQFDILLPMQDWLSKYRSKEQLERTAWDPNYEATAYLELAPGVNVEALEQKLTDVLYRHAGDGIRARNATATVELQPLNSLYLDRETITRLIQTGDPRTVYFFSVVALITLVIALVNYVNLATARAMNRAREVGVRKVVGAHRGQLMGQFLLESALTNLAALVLALALTALLTPAVNRLAGVHLSIDIWTSPLFLAVFSGVFVVGVVLSGIYPAFVLSSFRPVTVLKGKADGFAARAGLRKGLVVLQFAASIVLLIGTGVAHSQLDYMRRLDVGLDMEHVLVVTSPRALPEDMDTDTAAEMLQAELPELPGVTAVATAGNIAGRGFIVSAPARLTTADPSDVHEMKVTSIDEKFAGVYGIDLVAGQPFHDGMPLWFNTPSGQPVPALINEAAVRALGIPGNEAALGQMIELEDIRYIVQGVLKDFNWSSVHQPAEAVVFRYLPTNRFLSVKVAGADLPGTIASVRERFNTLFPGNVFDYTFADQAFAEQYRKDERFARLFALFAGLAIFIACLGLFGLTSFTAAQRQKEIGVRKVLGASVRSIVVLLSRDFLILVGIALLIGSPVAFYLMRAWLGDFARHITLGPGVFVIAGAAAIGIALVTVSYQAIRAALADPVKSLRYE